VPFVALAVNIRSGPPLTANPSPNPFAFFACFAVKIP
jgi:hypothetical protein